MNRLIAIGLLLLMLSCTKTSFKSERDFYRWANDSENGLIKKRSANGFELTVKYLPPEYLAYIEAGKQKRAAVDSTLINDFKDSKTFLLTIDFSDEKQRKLYADNVMHYGVSDMADYKERVHKLNFNMKEQIYIKTTDGKKLHPVLATMENIYHISSKKSLYLVFTDKDEQVDLNQSQTLDLVFEDDVFDTGINHFVFDGKEINVLPKFEFI